MLLLVLGCRVAEVRDVCVDEPGLCPPCAADADCALQGNPCLDFLDCAHVEAGLSYIEIGCSEMAEYRPPAGVSCRCEEAVCTSM